MEKDISKHLQEVTIIQKAYLNGRISTILPQYGLIIKKKPRGGELSVEDKENNTETSGRRILSEHAIGGAKRYGIVSDVYRNHRRGLDDEVMMVACGLWNYYLKTA